MKLRVRTGDSSGLRSRLRRFIRERGIPAAADALVKNIKRRMDEGKDPNGMPYTPYAESTKKRRAKKGLPTSHVTLQDTGAMYRSLNRKGKDRIAVDPSQEGKLKGHSGYNKNLPVRQVIGVNEEEDIPDMQRAVRDEWTS